MRNVPTLLHIGPIIGECQILLIGVADASKTLPSKSTLQKTLSAFSLEKFLTGDTAFIHSGISQSTSLTIVAPTADNALSTFTKRGESDFLVLTNKSGVQIGGSIFSERNQW